VLIDDVSRLGQKTIENQQIGLFGADSNFSKSKKVLINLQKCLKNYSLKMIRLEY